MIGSVLFVQAVDHPYLVVHSSTATNAAKLGSGDGVRPQENEGMCCCCHDPVEDPVQSACGHLFCRACVTEYIQGAVGQAKCPGCDKLLTVDLNGAAPVSSAPLLQQQYPYH